MLQYATALNSLPIISACATLSHCMLGTMSELHLDKPQADMHAFAQNRAICFPMSPNLASLPQVFRQLQAGEYLQWSVEASYVELYNETFRDLADPSMSPSDISIFEQQYVPLGFISLQLRGSEPAAFRRSHALFDAGYPSRGLLTIMQTSL